MVLLGTAHLGMGRLDHAQAAFDDALRLNPDVAVHVYSNKGAIYNLLERYQRAIYDLDEAIKSLNEAVVLDPAVGDARALLKELRKARASLQAS